MSTILVDTYIPQTAAQMIEAAHTCDWSPVAAVKLDKARFYMDLFTSQYPGTAAKCGNRIAGALRIMQRIGGRKRGNQIGLFLVQSESNARGWYKVDLLRRTCTCPDHPGAAAKGAICKHRLAVGVQIFGPDWIIVAQENQVREVAKRAREKDAAFDAAEAAWKIQLELVTRWEDNAERLGNGDPRVMRLAEELREATAHAQALSDYHKSLTYLHIPGITDRY